VGVFYNARKLLQIINKKVERFDKERAIVATCAALLHDLGHGPFSHTFEGVEKTRGKKKKHETWTAEIVEGDTEIQEILNKFDPTLAKKISALILAKEPTDIYAAIVSSQFDADRLDYLVRDRYMSGVEVGHFDMEWLLDCLEIDRVLVAQNPDQAIENQQFDYVDGFVINPKGFKAAEGYLEARFHLYSTVYLHKTTRGAEKLLASLLSTLSEALKTDGADKLNLPSRQSLVSYLTQEDPSLAQYLSLDDGSILSLLPFLQACPNARIAELATKLKRRHLYKCVDIGSRLRGDGSDEKVRFKRDLKEKVKELGMEFGYNILYDEPRLVGYDWYTWGEESTLKKVLVKGVEQNKNYDIGDRSEIIKALKKEDFYRIYVPDNEKRGVVEAIWTEIAKV